MATFSFSSSSYFPRTFFLTSMLVLTLSSYFLPSSSSTTPSSATKRPPFKKIYAFGDSFTDTGNTGNADGPSGFGHVSNHPYGITYFHRPTNRYSDGRLVIDFVAEYLSLPFLPPYHNLSGDAGDTGSVNFAVAGSTAINHDFFVKHNLTLDVTPQSIMSQLIWFNKLVGSPMHDGVAKGRVSPAAFEDVLFWVGEIGVNDYAYTIGSDVPGDTVRKLAIDTISSFLESLLRRGAKYMVVQGLPLSGCLPLAMYLAPANDRDDLGCMKSANDQTNTHNTVLQAKLRDLQNKYPSAVIVYADYWNAYRTVMKSPTKYGFKEQFKTCCGTDEPPYNFTPFATCGTPMAKACARPSEFINWDGVHLTEAMYKVVADMFLKGSFSHPPFSYLLSRKQTQGR